MEAIPRRHFKVRLHVQGIFSKQYLCLVRYHIMQIILWGYNEVTDVCEKVVVNLTAYLESGSRYI